MSKNHRPATPVQSVQVGSTQETDKLYGEFGDLLEALVPTVDINPMPFFRQISTFFVKAKEHARTLERQRDEARRELSDTKKLMNIYRGAVTAAVYCEAHKDVIAEHCPVCLLNERDEAMHALREIQQVLDNPPGITFNEMAAINVKAWKIARAALQSAQEKKS